jgi:hypothetical protein
LILCSFLAGIGAVVTHYFVDIEDITIKDKTPDNDRKESELSRI